MNIVILKDLEMSFLRAKHVYISSIDKENIDTVNFFIIDKYAKKIKVASQISYDEGIRLCFNNYMNSLPIGKRADMNIKNHKHPFTNSEKLEFILTDIRVNNLYNNELKIALKIV